MVNVNSILKKVCVSSQIWHYYTLCLQYYMLNTIINKFPTFNI